MSKIITFEKNTKEDILDLFDCAVDADGYIIEKQSGQKVPSSDGEPLELKDFVGLKKGSLVFIRTGINSVIELA